MVAGPKAIEYINGLEKSALDMDSAVFDRELKKQTKKLRQHYEDGR